MTKADDLMAQLVAAIHEAKYADSLVIAAKKCLGEREQQRYIADARVTAIKEAFVTEAQAVYATLAKV